MVIRTLERPRFRERLPESSLPFHNSCGQLDLLVVSLTIRFVFIDLVNIDPHKQVQIVFSLLSLLLSIDCHASR